MHLTAEAQQALAEAAPAAFNKIFSVRREQRSSGWVNNVPRNEEDSVLDNIIRENEVLFIALGLVKPRNKEQMIDLGSVNIVHRDAELMNLGRALIDVDHMLGEHRVDLGVDRNRMKS